MKQKIDFATLAPSLAEWMCGKLRAAPPEVPGSAELL